MSFLFFIWKNVLSFRHDINGLCRCVEFAGVMIITNKTSNWAMKIRPGLLAQDGCLVRTGHLPNMKVRVILA